MSEEEQRNSERTSVNEAYVWPKRHWDCQLIRTSLDTEKQENDNTYNSRFQIVDGFWVSTASHKEFKYGSFQTDYEYDVDDSAHNFFQSKSRSYKKCEKEYSAMKRDT